MHSEFPLDAPPEQGMVAGRVGFDSDPAAQLIAQYQQIATGEMHDLPFYRADPGQRRDASV